MDISDMNLQKKGCVIRKKWSISIFNIVMQILDNGAKSLMPMDPSTMKVVLQGPSKYFVMSQIQI
jgi:hypothetical protein